MTKENPTPEEVKEANVYSGVYRVLMAGMFLSTALFIIGVVLALLHPAVIPLNSMWILEQYHLGVLFQGLLLGNPASYMMLATILLILTPVTRVLVSIYAFWVDQDYKFVIVTATVFIVMALTVLSSFFGLK